VNRKKVNNLIINNSSINYHLGKKTEDNLSKFKNLDKLDTKSLLEIKEYLENNSNVELDFFNNILPNLKDTGCLKSDNVSTNDSKNKGIKICLSGENNFVVKSLNNILKNCKSETTSKNKKLRLNKNTECELDSKIDVKNKSDKTFVSNIKSCGKSKSDSEIGDSNKSQFSSTELSLSSTEICESNNVTIKVKGNNKKVYYLQCESNKNKDTKSNKIKKDKKENKICKQNKIGHNKDNNKVTDNKVTDNKDNNKVTDNKVTDNKDNNKTDNQDKHCQELESDSNIDNSSEESKKFYKHDNKYYYKHDNKYYYEHDNKYYSKCKEDIYELEKNVINKINKYKHIYLDCKSAITNELEINKHKISVHFKSKNPKEKIMCRTLFGKKILR
jgi:hypothetical protein